MHTQQISVFLENKTGRIAEVTSILAEANINIRALSLADTSDFGVLRLIVDNNAAAEEILKKNGLSVNKTDVVAVEVVDKPGGLFKILDLICDSSLNVEYMYTYVRPPGDNAIIIFRFDDPDKATGILAENDIVLIGEDKIYTM